MKKEDVGDFISDSISNFVVLLIVVTKLLAVTGNQQASQEMSTGLGTGMSALVGICAGLIAILSFAKIIDERVLHPSIYTRCCKCGEWFEDRIRTKGRSSEMYVMCEDCRHYYELRNVLEQVDYNIRVAYSGRKGCKLVLEANSEYLGANDPVISGVCNFTVECNCKETLLVGSDFITICQSYNLPIIATCPRCRKTWLFNNETEEMVPCEVTPIAAN